MKRWLLLLTVAACAPAPAPQSAPPVDAECVTGVVANLGVDRQRHPVLRTAAHGLVHLTGPAADAVLELTGATVMVCGAREAAAIAVESYELREVDGMPAVSGILESEGAGFVLDRGADRGKVRLLEVPAALSAQLRQQVWVAGEWVGPELLVKSFGLLGRAGH